MMEVFLIRSFSHYSKARSRSNYSSSLPTKLVLVKGKNPANVHVINPLKMHPDQTNTSMKQDSTNCFKFNGSKGADGKELRLLVEFTPQTILNLNPGKTCINYSYEYTGSVEMRQTLQIFKYSVAVWRLTGKSRECLLWREFESMKPVDIKNQLEVYYLKSRIQEDSYYALSFKKAEDYQTDFYPFKLKVDEHAASFKDSKGSVYLLTSTPNCKFKSMQGLVLAEVYDLICPSDQSSSLGLQIKRVMTSFLTNLMHVANGHKRKSYLKKTFPAYEGVLSDAYYQEDADFMRTLHTIVITLQMLEKVVHPYIAARIQASTKSRRKAPHNRLATLETFLKDCEQLHGWLARLDEWTSAEEFNIFEAINAIKEGRFTFEWGQTAFCVVQIACKREAHRKGTQFLEAWQSLGGPDAKAQSSQIDQSLVGTVLPFWRSDPFKETQEAIKRIVNYAVTNSFGVVLEPKPWSHKLNVRKIYLGQLEIHATMGKNIDVGLGKSQQNGDYEVIALDNSNGRYQRWKMPLKFSKIKLIHKYISKLELLIEVLPSQLYSTNKQLYLLQLPRRPLWGSDRCTELVLNQIPVQLSTEYMISTTSSDIYVLQQRQQQHAENDLVKIDCCYRLDSSKFALGKEINLPCPPKTKTTDSIDLINFLKIHKYPQMVANSSSILMGMQDIIQQNTIISLQAVYLPALKDFTSQNSKNSSHDTNPQSARDASKAFPTFKFSCPGSNWSSIFRLVSLGRLSTVALIPTSKSISCVLCCRGVFQLVAGVETLPTGCNLFNTQLLVNSTGSVGIVKYSTFQSFEQHHARTSPKKTTPESTAQKHAQIVCYRLKLI
jgi:hypothetical protein